MAQTDVMASPELSPERINGSQSPRKTSKHVDDFLDPSTSEDREEEEDEPCSPVTQIFITPQGVDPALFANSVGLQQIGGAECNCCRHKKEKKKEKRKEKKNKCCHCGKVRRAASSGRPCNGDHGSSRGRCDTGGGRLQEVSASHECHCEPSTTGGDTERNLRDVDGMIPGAQTFLLFLQAYGLGATMIKNINRRREEGEELPQH